MAAKDSSIFIVDDVSLIRDQVAGLLSTSGFKKVFKLPHPTEALDWLKTKPCQLILAELHSSPVHGFDFLKTVRADPQLRHIGFIFLTADASPTNVEKAIELGADDYILKPFVPNQVESKLFGTLMKRQSSS